MGIERGYYYKKKRKGNKVISEYAGKANDDNKLLKHDRERLKCLQEFKRDIERVKSERKAISSKINQLLDTVESVIKIKLELIGYRTHKGELRKCRKS